MQIDSAQFLKGIDWYWSAMINAEHCRSMSINADQFLRAIDRQLAVTGIDWHWDQEHNLIVIDWHWLAVIGIGQWSRESCVIVWVSQGQGEVISLTNKRQNNDATLTRAVSLCKPNKRGYMEAIHYSSGKSIRSYICIYHAESFESNKKWIPQPCHFHCSPTKFSHSKQCKRSF